jgi:methionyl-tRNA formyltransferase
MYLVFLGNDPWSVPSLQAIAAEPAFDVALVITNPPRPAGRGSRLVPTAVADAARTLGVPLLETAGVRSGAGLEAIRSASPDALVVVAYGELLSPEVLAVPRLGAVNVHFSLLPRWRGASPVQHALLEGDTTTGVTVMMMDAGLDTGAILATTATEIDPADDAGSLGSRLAESGAELLTGTLSGLRSGAVHPTPQPIDGVTRAPKLGASDRLITWSRPAARILAQVRAFAPDPGATTRFRDASLKVLAADATEPGPGAEGREPGTVDAVETDGPLIITGAGSIRLRQVAQAGRKRMGGADWARGARIQPGERLG